MDRSKKWGEERIQRSARTGRYVKSTPCDACGKPVGEDYCTDDEVCGSTDGPGFYLCTRARCAKRRDALDVEARRAFYTEQRKANAQAQAS